MADHSHDAVAWRELLTRQYAASLVLVCAGVWLHAADSLIVATMLPAIVDEIGGRKLVSWTVSLYQIGSIVSGAASGFLALRHGIRVPMSVAACLFALGCAVSALAATMWLVLAGRVLQGVGGGGLVALSFVAVGGLFPERLMPRALAMVSLLWGTSAFLGPLIGGLFVEYANWRLGFVFFAAQALLLALWIGLYQAPRPALTDAQSEQRVALTRLLLLAAGVVLVSCAGVEVAWWRTLLLVIAGLACIGVFCWLDQRAPANRMLPADATNPSTVTGAVLLMIVCFTMATIAITAYGPLLMVMIHDTPILVAGYVVACSSIGWSVAAIGVSGFGHRYDRRFIALGMLMLAVSVAGFLYSMPNGPIGLIAAFAFIEGAGFGMAWVFILRQITNHAALGESERVAAAMPTVQRLGYALGAAYIGIVANASGFSDQMSGADARGAAVAIYVSCLPFVVVGLVALAKFLTLASAAAVRR